MFSKLIGYSSIITGVLCIIRPENLRQAFIGKSWRIIFWALVGMLSYPLVHFGNKIGLAGVVAVFVLFWFVMRAAGSAIKAVFCRVPAVALQFVGLLQVLSGAALVWWPK